MDSPRVGTDTSGDLLWQLLESETASLFPQDLKDIVKICKYDSLLSLSKFSEKDASDIENFMKGTLHKIVKEDERSRYYGIFANAPEYFSLGGYKNTLLQLASVAESIMQNNKRKSPYEKFLPNKKKGYQPSVFGSQTPSPKQKSLDDEILGERLLLEELIKSWIPHNVPEMCEVDSSLTVNICVSSDGLGSFIANVVCPKTDCLKSIKVTKNEHRWNTSNLYKHFKCHKTPPKQQNTLINMFGRTTHAAPHSDSGSPVTSSSHRSAPQIHISSDEVQDAPTHTAVCVEENSTGNTLSSQCNSRRWSLQHYSRSEREKRKLQVAANYSTRITDFFPVLNKLEVLLSENEDLKKRLLGSMKITQNSNNISNLQENLPNFLKALLECAFKNSERKPEGKRYSSTLKQMASLLFILGGCSTYQLLANNLPLPSITTVKREMYSAEVMKEGEFRFKQLREFLHVRGLPLQVFISEDATNITGRVQYHHDTNQIVGLVLPFNEHGLPSVGSFPATSAQSICDYFEGNDISKYAYTYVAQPIDDKAPTMCIALFGSNNKFNSAHVMKRWEWINKKAKEEGIEILGYASDGDPRMLKAMMNKVLNKQPTDFWPWFHALKCSTQLLFQDFIHFEVKLKSKLLQSSCILPMGPDFVASKGHLAELIETVSRDQHQLSSFMLNPKDKMNFRSAEKIASEKVIALLRSSVHYSEGTAIYLEMMLQTCTAFISKELSPLARVEIVWEWTFFLRFWRQWIIAHPEYTLKHNFITSNAYSCLELNAHALIQAIIKFRDMGRPDLFKPWLFSSQPCEAFFRLSRSLTSTQSTVVNFGCLELLYRVRRLDYMGSAFSNLQGIYSFPKNRRAFYIKSNEQEKTFQLPDDQQIEEAVIKSFQKAVQRALNLKLLKSPPGSPPPPNFPQSRGTPGTDDIEDEIDSAEVVYYASEDEDCENENNVEDEECDRLNDMEDVAEDLLITISTNTLGLKTFSDVTVSPTSPFVIVKDGTGSSAIIKKTSLCWLLSSGDTCLSSDRLQRVQQGRSNSVIENPMSPLSSIPNPTREDSLSAGKWCAFFEQDKSVVIGRILAFRYLSGSTVKSQEYQGHYAPVKCNSRPIGVMCSWFKIQNKVLKHIPMDLHGYYDICNYICTVPRPNSSSKQLKLTCTLKEILKCSKP